MSIQYHVIKRAIPGIPEEKRKYYARTISRGEIDIRELANKISGISTLSSIDVKAVLEALLLIIPRELANSRIIRLGDFGSFYTTIQTTGALKEEEFTGTNITKTMMRYRPGVLVKKAMSNVSYKKI